MSSFRSEQVNAYRVGTNDSGAGSRPCIVIDRKPSEIPPGLHIDLMHSGCVGLMDGPNNVCTFEFFDEACFVNGEKHLTSRGWVRS